MDNKKEINFMAADELGFIDLGNKHTHIVWGRDTSGKQHQINIFKNTDQLIDLVEALRNNSQRSGVLIHCIQTNLNIREAMLNFVEYCYQQSKQSD